MTPPCRDSLSPLHATPAHTCSYCEAKPAVWGRSSFASTPKPTVLHTNIRRYYFPPVERLLTMSQLDLHAKPTTAETLLTPVLHFRCMPGTIRWTPVLSPEYFTVSWVHGASFSIVTPQNFPRCDGQHVRPKNRDGVRMAWPRIQIASMSPPGTAARTLIDHQFLPQT